MGQNDYPAMLASKDRACVIAPAGYGKTQTIALAVATHEDGCQLILTHTHAGVKSLRDRLRRLGVPSRAYRIETIASFALKYAGAFPKISQLPDLAQDGLNWNEIYVAATRAFESSAVKRILDLSYAGIYIDEYQDCTLEQHAITMSLAAVLPSRVLGDPLQGIFDFGDNELVNWHELVFPQFERLPDLDTAWRWVSNNTPQIGEWLSGARDCLMRGNDLSVQSLPLGVAVIQGVDQETQRQACYSVAREHGSIVAIHGTANQAHYLARRLGRTYSSMEEIEARDLLSSCDALEQSVAHDRVIAILDFAEKCINGTSQELRVFREKCRRGDHDLTKRLDRNVELAGFLNAVMRDDSLQTIINAIEVLERLFKNRHFPRKELWEEMKRTLKEYQLGEYDSMRDAARAVRDRGRIFGRHVGHRIISRTLLIKGLEFDHAIVLNADELDAKNLYVAMTRGAKSLTLLTTAGVIRKQSPWQI